MAVIKQAKGYDPALAQRTLGAATGAAAATAAPETAASNGRGATAAAASSASRLLLLELGFDDFEDFTAVAEAPPCSSCNGGGLAERPELAGDACPQSPYAAEPPGARVVVKESSVQRRSRELQDRAAAAAHALSTSSCDPGPAANFAGEALSLLLELARHINVLQQGNDSLQARARECRRTSSGASRGSAGLPQSSTEAEAQARLPVELDVARLRAQQAERRADELAAAAAELDARLQAAAREASSLRAEVARAAARQAGEDEALVAGLKALSAAAKAVVERQRQRRGAAGVARAGEGQPVPMRGADEGWSVFHNPAFEE